MNKSADITPIVVDVHFCQLQMLLRSTLMVDLEVSLSNPQILLTLMVVDVSFCNLQMSSG